MPLPSTAPASSARRKAWPRCSRTSARNRSTVTAALHGHRLPTRNHSHLEINSSRRLRMCLRMRLSPIETGDRHWPEKLRPPRSARPVEASLLCETNTAAKDQRFACLRTSVAVGPTGPHRERHLATPYGSPRPRPPVKYLSPPRPTPCRRTRGDDRRVPRRWYVPAVRACPREGLDGRNICCCSSARETSANGAGALAQTIHASLPLRRY